MVICVSVSVVKAFAGGLIMKKTLLGNVTDLHASVRIVWSDLDS